MYNRHWTNSLRYKRNQVRKALEIPTCGCCYFHPVQRNSFEGFDKLVFVFLETVATLVLMGVPLFFISHAPIGGLLLCAASWFGLYSGTRNLKYCETKKVESRDKIKTALLWSVITGIFATICILRLRGML